MIFDLTRKATVVLGSLVTLVTALAVAISQFITAVAPSLPNGWQDDAFRWGGIVTTVLLAAMAGLRRLTEVPKDQHGILPPG
jgi:hypothetical protein